MYVSVCIVFVIEQIRQLEHESFPYLIVSIDLQALLVSCTGVWQKGELSQIGPVTVVAVLLCSALANYRWQRRQQRQATSDSGYRPSVFSWLKQLKASRLASTRLDLT